MKLKKTTFLLLFLFIPLLAFSAKTDKNASKAIFSITSYDKDGKTLGTGYGFFISQDGYALSTFDALKDAYSAEITDARKKKWKVTRICGASSLYNIVKFKTDCAKSNCLPLAETKLTKGEEATVLACKTKETIAIPVSVSEVSSIDSMGYYTLQGSISNNYAGSPILNNKGEVAATLQTSQGKDSTHSFALDITFAKLLYTTGMSATEIALNSIHIAKQLPEEEPQARTFIYLFAQNSKDTLVYLSAIEDYITAFPQETLGYTQRATYRASLKDYAKADEDLEQGLANAKEKGDIHYEKSKLIYRLNMMTDYKQYKDWDMTKALDEANEALACNPLPLFTLQKADCQFAAKQYAEAFLSYQEVNKSNIASPQTFGAAAVAAEMSKQDSTVVLALLDSAIARYGTPSPKAASIYILQRASHLDRYGRYKEAAKDYQEVEDLQGAQNLNDNFFYIKSLCDTRARLYSRALADIEKALLMRPDDYDYTVEKALAQWRMGNYDEAIYAGKQALKLNPRGADAYKAIGLAYGEQGKKAEAIENLKKAKELGDPQAQALIESMNGK